MGRYRIIYTKQAKKDAYERISGSGLKQRVLKLIKILELNPYQNPPPFEKLKGDLKGAYSRRISLQHRLVYEIIEESKTVKILRMWTHYDNDSK